MPQLRTSYGPKLPRSLLDQVSGSLNHAQRRARRPHQNHTNVKQKQGYKSNQGHAKPARRAVQQHAASDTEDDFDGFDEDGETDEDERGADKRLVSKAPPTNDGSGGRLERDHARTETREDREIAELEKKLGVKKKKKGQEASTAIDGGALSELLGGLSESESDHAEVHGVKRKNEEYEAWLASKRHKSSINNESDSEDLSEDTDNNSNGTSVDVETFAGSDQSRTTTREVSKPKRENPYKAPVPVSESTAPKYVPLAARTFGAEDKDAIALIQRRVQGQVNRLSEANVLSILAEIEVLYRSHPRQYVSSALIDVLLAMLADRSSLMDNFLTLHAGLVAAVYRVVGADFGAQMVERVCLRFDEEYNKIGIESTGKQVNNLISLLGQLYVLNVINSNIMFEYLSMLLQTVTETNTELLLRVVRSCGLQLRQDDPTALKEIVATLQKTLASTAQDTLSVRTKFMIETIHDLKNNRMKGGASQSSVAAERLTAMKKTLGQLASRPSLATTEPLAISLTDIRNAGKSGKWWLVGASWKGRDESGLAQTQQRPRESGKHTGDIGSLAVSDDRELLELAKQHRMNTDIRRAIFITIMSASDFKDCHMKLLKLRLSRVQEQELPRVLLHCTCAEERYNPYYTAVASRLCSEHKIRHGFQRSLWDYFKRMSGSADGEDISDDEGDARVIHLSATVNLARFYAELVLKRHLSLSILKNLDLLLIKSKTRTFVEILLITVLQQESKAAKTKLKEIFEDGNISPELARDVYVFLKKDVLRSDLIRSQSNHKRVVNTCKEAIAILRRVATEEGTDRASVGGNGRPEEADEL